MVPKILNTIFTVLYEVIMKITSIQQNIYLSSQYIFR